MTERMIETDGVRLCVETFGDPDDAPVLLVMGMAASMLWWDERFCRVLADGGRLVVRYDHRDTGRSTTYEPGGPATAARTSRRTSAASSTGSGCPRRICSGSRWAAGSPRTSPSSTPSARAPSSS